MSSKSTPQEFDTRLPGDHFLSKYVDFGTDLTDAYPEYHLGSGLSLLSVSVDRNVRVMVNPSPMYPNFWVLLLGPSTVSRKSTALNLLRDVLDRANLDKKLPEDFSPEAFVQELEANPQSAFIKDEFGELLAKMGRSYQSGIGELLCEMYGSPREYERVLRGGRFQAEEIYLTLIGACVPAQARYLTMADIESGFIPRMGIIWPDRPKSRKPIDIYEEQSDETLDMLAWETKVRHEALEEIADEQDSPIRAVPDKSALRVYNEWCEDIENYLLNSTGSEDLQAVAGRAQQAVLKVACLIELGSAEMFDRLDERVSSLSRISRVSPFREFRDKNGGKDTNSETDEFEFKISEKSMKVAIHYAHNIFLPHSRRLVNEIQEGEHQDELRRVHRMATRHADGDGKISRSKLLQNTGVYADKLDRCVETLKEANLLREKESGKTTYYFPTESSNGDDLPEISFETTSSFEVDGDW